MSAPSPNDNINRLVRKDQCTIFQFRTTHAKVHYHLNRTNPLHLPLCRNCSAPYETTHHVLLECPELQSLRKKYLPPDPTISNTLYGPVAQLQNTCCFINLALSKE